MESKLSSSRSADNAYEAEFGEPPHDKCWIVWLIIMLHGIGVLIPWNMFITIAPQLLFSAMTWFYYVTLTIVVILNGSNGLYQDYSAERMFQNSVFGLTADFPAAYTNAIVVGNNICGTFISILSIATNLAFITDSKSVALTYFSITLAVLVVCILSLFYLTQVEFYKYYVNKGKQARIAEHATRPSLRQFCETFKGCWMQLLSVFLVFFVTLAVFPAVLAGTTPNRKGEPWNSDIPKDIYLGLTVFLNFNLLAAIGSTTANFVQIPGPNYILFPVLLRLLFIPYFMLCNYNVDDRVMPVLFENQWFFIIGNAIMAFTSGYFSSLAMMYAPRVVHSSLSKTAGMAAAAILVTGTCLHIPNDQQFNKKMGNTQKESPYIMSDRGYNN
ncbi:unnamed protein product [Haemonchus placei]|uniref:Aa_trans domain-containing protein n=1 Tax=Haemonchus placei TaxID=6290 RepID=A0A0N4W1N6_HAEPC|nr:unnamed protein product [Haemonchus placei]